MVGKILNRTRYLWILIILSFVLLGAAVALLVYSARPKNQIPQKGVFVYTDNKKISGKINL